MSDKLEPSADQKSSLGRAMAVASLVRDVGMILGVPLLLTIGVKLYDLQTKSLEDQIKANEAQVKAVEAQNSLLKETQYDRALALLKSQKEIFEMERTTLENKISDLQVTNSQVSDINTEQSVIEREAREEATKKLTAKLSEAEVRVKSADALITVWERCLRSAGGNAVQDASCDAILPLPAVPAPHLTETTTRPRAPHPRHLSRVVRSCTLAAGLGPSFSKAPG